MATVTASRSENLPRPLACQSARPQVAGPDGQPAPGVDFSAELIRHQRRLYLFIGTMLANPSDIEDVYQQACLAMWQRREQFRDVQNFFAFACSFARHEALHLIRRNVRKGCVHLSEEMLATLADEAEADESGDPYLAALTGCLRKLPAPQRELLKRRYSGLETVKQIAVELGISAASLTMRLQRIRQSLVKCIEATLAAEDGR